MTDDRTDPDILLSRIAESERMPEKPGGRGKLKIFLGMSAGVGKTYAMLSEARAKKEEGADVVAAYVETHGREDTAQMLAGLERLPERTIEYRGIVLREPDYDALRIRHPAIALVDELPHTNAPGTLRLKRWQDVLDLLDDGISVWTALNVQHIESVADVVEDLTYAPIRERVPDSVLDAADELRLIDVAPETLLERLSEGKIYRGEQSAAAMDRFFKPRNLSALRELALRWSMQNASARNEAYGRIGESGRYAKSGTRLLVAVGASPSSEYLVRWTRRAASAQRADWIAVNIVPEGGNRPGEAARIEKTLDLARKLGAQVVSLTAPDVVDAVVAYARTRGVTQMVVGKSGLTATKFPWRRSSLAERFLRESADIDCVAVQERGGIPRVPFMARLRRRFVSLLAAPAGQYAFAGGSFLCLSLLNIPIAAAASYKAVAIVYLAGVALASLWLSLGPVLSLATVSALAWNFLFIPPLFTFSITRPDDALTFILYFIVALVTGSLTARKRANERALEERERHMRALYDISRRLAAAQGVDECAEIAVNASVRCFGGPAVFFDSVEEALSPIGSGALEIDEKEAAAAKYAGTSGEVCGAGSDSLPSARFRWMPLSAGGTPLGSLGIRLPEGAAWSASSKELATAFAFEVSGAVGRERLAEARRRNAFEVESERLARTLLNSVSHEMRTPLTAILGSASALTDQAVAGNAAARTALLAEILPAAKRLDLLVENLLSMTRIESGALRLKMEAVDPGELLAAAVEDARAAMGPGPNGERPIRIDTAQAGREVRLDEALAVQALSNIVRNALRYSPEGGSVELTALKRGDDFVCTVRDRGPGVPETELGRIFEKFFKSDDGSKGGLGLGLSICKGIAEAHGGGVSARLPEDGGLEVSIVFPSCAIEVKDEPSADH